MLGEDTDANFEAAIAKALSTFNTVTATGQQKTAQRELVNSEVIFNGGNGDITNFGQNMSFENLSAQSGTETTGVEPTPAGWTLYVDGQEQDAATVKVHDFGWCAINTRDALNMTDGEGNSHTQQPSDGTHLWGIWSSKMPEVQLSQTIFGLPRGTYLLTADLMVQNNWAGNNMTTQRIFRNGCVQMWGGSLPSASNRRGSLCNRVAAWIA